MDHADARARLDELFLEPASPGEAAGRLDPALELHLEGCAECSTDYAALRATAAAIQLAMGPPQAARRRVLDNVAQLGRRRQPAPSPIGAAATLPSAERAPPSAARWGLSWPRALAAAAVLAVLAFVAGALSGVLLDPPRPEQGRLAYAATMMAELARDPTAQTLTLRDPRGEVGGTVIFEPNRRMLVVFSESLTPPAEGRYDCFVERDGERSWIGPMLHEADASFWAGPVDGAPADLGRTGDRFIVLRDPTDLAPMLEADF